MYIRSTTRQYKGKTYTNYLLVESLHTPKGPRQKVVCSLGDLAPRPKQEWLKLAREVQGKLSGQEPLFDEPDQDAEAVVRRVQEEKAAKGKKGKVDRRRNRPGDCVAVRTDEVTTERHREAGSVVAAWQGRLVERVRVPPG